MCVARYSTPPASTVSVAAGPTWMRPDEPVGGCRLPWKSLMASNCTLVSCALAIDGNTNNATSAAAIATTLLISLPSRRCLAAWVAGFAES
jgi:hypothetical protein